MESWQMMSEGRKERKRNLHLSRKLYNKGEKLFVTFRFMKTINMSEYVSENEFSKQIHEYIDASSERLEQQ